MAKSRGVDLRSDTLWTGHDGNDDLRRAFAWLARTGIGVRAGSRPIGWVQQHNVAAIDAIEAAAKNRHGDLSKVSVRGGAVYAGSVRLGSVSDFYDKADRAART